MSALKVHLIFATCVLIIPHIIGIQVHQFRYPKDNKWKTNTRQDVFTSPRYFMWKSQAPPVYANPNYNPLFSSAVSMYYNRYGLTPIPLVIHHPNYMLGMPQAKLNNYSYRKKKDLLNMKSNAGKFPHFTYIKALLPKPYIALPTIPLQHSQQEIRDYRTNKQTTYYPMNSVRSISNTNSSGTYSQLSPSIPHEKTINGLQPITKFHTSDRHTYNQNSSRTADSAHDQCANIDSNVAKLYCTTPYNNGTKKREIIHLPELSKPAVIEPIRDGINRYTTPKPIFLPTIPQLNSYFFPETTTIKNSKIAWTHTIPIIETTTISTPKKYHLHEHNFFTIEDAITVAPFQNYVFNNPFEALAHARKRKNMLVKDQITNERHVVKDKNIFFNNSFDDETDLASDYRKRPPYFSYESGRNHDNRRGKFKSKDSYDDRNNQWKQLTPTTFNESIFDKDTTTMRPYTYGDTKGIQLFNDTQDNSETTTLRPFSFKITKEKVITTTTSTTKTTTAPIVTTKSEENTTENTVTESTNEHLIITTVASHNTTMKNKLMSHRFKHFFSRNVNQYTTEKTPLTRALNNIKNSTSAIAASAASKNKQHKYRRDYKPKKYKIITNLTSTTTTSTTTLATTTKSSKNVMKKIQRTISSTTPTLSHSRASRTHSERLQRHKSQNSKRQKTKKRNEKISNVATGKSNSRHTFFTPSPITKSKSVPSSLSAETASVTPTFFPSTRKSAYESKVKNYHGKKMVERTHIINDVTTAAIKQLSRTPISPSSKDGDIPPLPIEIYFKSVQNLTSSM